ncbi:hypothetical protein FCJ61_39050 [Burkholderia metallica]|uniref:hypothetical protein n=1 Tax=Burkholderia metallica TaxID=488729 RepID=UPI00157B4ABB|nr:hypothetical protein [Burkholderia metallica]NTZ88826.1 hypothetical protein [Burkholderia metallica]
MKFDLKDADFFHRIVSFSAKSIYGIVGSELDGESSRNCERLMPLPVTCCPRARETNNTNRSNATARAKS